MARYTFHLPKEKIRTPDKKLNPRDISDYPVVAEAFSPETAEKERLTLAGAYPDGLLIVKIDGKESDPNQPLVVNLADS